MPGTARRSDKEKGKKNFPDCEGSICNDVNFMILFYWIRLLM